MLYKTVQELYSNLTFVVRIIYFTDNTNFSKMVNTVAEQYLQLWIESENAGSGMDSSGSSAWILAMLLAGENAAGLKDKKNKHDTVLNKTIIVVVD